MVTPSLTLSRIINKKKKKKKDEEKIEEKKPVTTIKSNAPEAPPAPEPSKDPLAFFKDPTTGGTTGFTDPKTGKTFLGPISPEQEEGIRRRAAPIEAVREEQRLADIERQKQGLLEEGRPVRQELDPQRTGLEKIPIFGGFATAGRALGKKVKKSLGIPLLDDREFDPSTFRTAELAAIAKVEAEKVLTFNQIFGGFAEALPTGDSILGVSFAKTLEKPSENAEEVFSNIRKVKRQITNIETNVKLGYLPQSVANEQLDDMEENVIRLESRLKSYINNSPSLKFNSDRVNTMETDILSVKEKLFQSRLNVLEGKIQDPDEMALFIKKQELGLNDEEGEV